MLRSRNLKFVAAVSAAALLSGCAGGEMGGLVGSVAGGLLMGAATDFSDMDSITAGMALGAATTGAGSEIANATGAELQRVVARQPEGFGDLAAIERQYEDAIADGLARGTAEREAAAAREREAQRLEEEARSETASLNAAQADLARGDVERVRLETERAAARRAEEERRAEAERRRRTETEARERREAEAREARERERAAAEAERNRLIDFPEVIVLCALEGPQAQFGNWRCQGGLQTTYAKLDTAQAAVPLSQACGGGTPHELGETGGYRAFGCGFGMLRGGVGAYSDPAARLGVSYVPGRTIFRCPASQGTSSCRSH